MTDSNRDSSSKVEQLNKVGNLESNYQKHAEKHSHHANNCPCRKWDQHQYELGVLKVSLNFPFYSFHSFLKNYRLQFYLDWSFGKFCHLYTFIQFQAFTDLKRYDSDYKRRTKENFSKVKVFVVFVIFDG